MENGQGAFRSNARLGMLLFRCSFAFGKTSKKIGRMSRTAALSLSGGGFRATLFHLGSLWRLNELGMLSTLNTLTGVSGGAITAAMLGIRWNSLIFDSQGVATNFYEEVAAPLLAFTTHSIDFVPMIASLAGAAIGGVRNSRLSARYGRGLFADQTLQDFPHRGKGPQFVLFATSLQTGEAVGMSQERLWIRSIGWVDQPSITVAKAVAASSAFPPALSPVAVDVEPRDWRPFPRDSIHFRDTSYREKLLLIDGGVRDNLGLEEIWEDHDLLLVSDAGARVKPKPRPSAFLYSLFRRAIDISYAQAQSLRKEILIEHKYKAHVLAKKKHGAYWSIGTPIAAYRVDDRLARDNQETAALAQLRTRLNAFTDAERGELVNWGYALADSALRRWVCPVSTLAPNHWPIPAFGFQPLGSAQS